MSAEPDWSTWEAQISRFLARRIPAGDPVHDLDHARRVAANAGAIARAEEADLPVVLPAAWLHDCVAVPKDSPMRGTSSTLSAQVATDFLRSISYPERHLQDIHHAIAAHSFSAGIRPRTLEAMVVQDADRLDALGAIGIARCMMIGGALGRRLYDPAEPVPVSRTPDDSVNTLDHFPVKLLRLAGEMNTATARAEAGMRTAYMEAYLEQLAREIPAI